MLDTSLNKFKLVFAHKFFVVPADQNYFLARFAKTYGMHEEFWWQSLQTIEKLLKAGLILNNVSVKNGFGHNIEVLWKKHLETFGDEAVKSLSKPEQLHADFWSDTSLEKIISAINQMGQPDSRYGLISYANYKDDIFKLDQLVFELRRRTIGLDWIVGDCGWPEDKSLIHFTGRPYRTVIQEVPDYQGTKLNLPKGKFETVGSDLEDVLYSWNLAFTRNPEDISRPPPATVAPSIAGFGNSYLYLLWTALDGTEITPQVREKVCWLLDHVRIGNANEADFREVLKKK